MSGSFLSAFLAVGTSAAREGDRSHGHRFTPHLVSTDLQPFGLAKLVVGSDRPGNLILSTFLEESSLGYFGT